MNKLVNFLDENDKLIPRVYPTIDENNILYSTNVGGEKTAEFTSNYDGFLVVNNTGNAGRVSILINDIINISLIGIYNAGVYKGGNAIAIRKGQNIKIRNISNVVAPTNIYGIKY